MVKEQTDTRPISNYDDTRYFERKHNNTNTLPRSYRYRGVNSQQNPKTRVKFEPKIERPTVPNGYEKSGKEVPRKNEYYQQTSSATSDSEYESILSRQYADDNESEHEVLFDDSSLDYSRTLTEMESEINATTNQYFRKIKSTLSETCSKLKIQQKHKPKKKSSPCNKQGAGDFKNTQVPQPDNDVYIDKMLKLKTDCYKKIDQNLQILQKIDQVNDNLYKNYIPSGSKLNQ